MVSSKINKPSIFRKTLNGALAGLIATVPMTAVMLLGRRFLPRRERYLLPPQEITQEMLERWNLDDRLGSRGRDGVALGLHFLYGALTGAGYALTETRVPLLPSMKGAWVGMAVWTGSYLGWLPAARVLRSALHHPTRRNLLMIVAHIVWGITLGLVNKRLNA